MKKTAAFIGLIFLLSSCSAGGDTQQPAKTRDGIAEEWRQQTAIREEICREFVINKMVTPQGSIRTNYLDGEYNEQLATGAQALSESSGLLMLYAAESGDKALFDKLLSFVEDTLDTGGIFAYRYSKEQGVWHVNAFVDDMRIIRALLKAGKAFGEDYIDTALEYADRLYDTNIVDGYIYDMYDEQYGITNDFITLCYADLYTVKLLGSYDAKWGRVYENALGIVMGGYISDKFPLFVKSYSYFSGKYSDGGINMVEASLTALNLAEVGECPEATIDYLKEKINNGALYASYSSGGVKTSDIQSTAIYAICALIAKEVKDDEMYMSCIDKMNEFQVTDEVSEVYGAFADAQSLELYSFDNLMALLAYRQE